MVRTTELYYCTFTSETERKMKELNPIIKKIWDIANASRSAMDLSMTMNFVVAMMLLRRVDCIVGNKRGNIVKLYQQVRNVYSSERLENELMAVVAPYKVYNVSEKSLTDLSKYAMGNGNELRAYVMSCSENVKRVLANLDLEAAITYLVSAHTLDEMMEMICEVDLSPLVVSDEEMENMMFNVMELFYSGMGRKAGEFSLTDSIRLLMGRLCLDGIVKSNSNYSIYDGTCGNGGLLYRMNSMIKGYHANAYCCGQEINTQTWSIAQAINLLSASDNFQIVNGNTLLQDAFPNETFDFVVCDSPYGIRVNYGERLYDDSRFKFMAPNVDGSIFFLQNGLSKLVPEKGRMVALTTGGLFFNMSAGIKDFRRYVVESDIVDTIISLPAGIQMGTSIPFYLCLFNLNKSAERKGKIQLIDGSTLFTTIGGYRRILSNKNIDSILKTYKSFSDNNISKIISNDEFGYYEIEIEKDGKTVDTEQIPLNIDSQKYLEHNIIPNLPKGEHVNLANTRKEYVINFKSFFLRPEKEEKFSDLKDEFDERQDTICNLTNEVMPRILGELANNQTTNKEGKYNFQKTRIKDIAELNSGKSVKPDHITSDGVAYILTVSNISDSNINVRDLKQVTEEGLNEGHYCLIEPGDIIFSNVGTIGKCAIVPDSDKPFILSSNLIKIKVLRDKCNPKYLFRLIASKKFQDKVRRLTIGDVINRINIKSFGGIEYDLPSIENQNKIISILDNNVEKIENLRHQMVEQAEVLEKIRDKYVDMKIL